MSSVRHLGLIPDGNRRWAAQLQGDGGVAGVGALLDHHMRGLVRLALGGWSDALAQRPELSALRELSVYMLSADNLRKRQDPITFGMVYGMLEGVLVLALVGAILRHVWLRDYDDQCARSDGRLRVGWRQSSGTDERRVTVIIRDPASLVHHPAVRAAARACPPQADAVARILRLIFRGDSCHSGDAPDSSRPLLHVTSDALLEHAPAAWKDLITELCSEGRHTGVTAAWITLQHDPNLMDDICVLCSDPARGRRAAADLRRLAAGMLAVRVFGQVDALPDPRHQDILRVIEGLYGWRAEARVNLIVNLAIAYDPVYDLRLQLQTEDHTAAHRPDIDLVIRTSGEQRSSGFFPLQTLYSEWAYLPELFPDLTLERVIMTLREYALRNRRFGA